MLSIDDAWSQYLTGNINDKDNICNSQINNGDIYNLNINSNEDNSFHDEEINDINMSNCSPLYISTKTKIVFLNYKIDIYNIFWKLNIIDYDNHIDGIIKKQIKISCLSHEELDEINIKLEKEKYVKCYIINSIDNPNGRVKFKNIQKISIGLSKKDILNARSKQKSAFYNCFVLTMRLYFNYKYKEIHVKVFNTGKVEIPGVQNDDLFYSAINKLIEYLQYFYEEKLEYNKENIENILINSNFNCGFCINRENLYNILRHKYNIHVCYDPCSYPGIQCIFHYNTYKSEQLGYIKECDDINGIIKISFMIFRTGSILIVGRCDDKCIYDIYNYLKKLLYKEYLNIVDQFCNNIKNDKKKKNKRLCKKYIYVSSDNTNLI
jgi:TATA-box binding protein (TBP) (component of TFIID and TFIIIB)